MTRHASPLERGGETRGQKERNAIDLGETRGRLCLGARQQRGEARHKTEGAAYIVDSYAFLFFLLFLSFCRDNRTDNKRGATCGTLPSDLLRTRVSGCDVVAGVSQQKYKLTHFLFVLFRGGGER